ncbi:MAG: hypothetical protein V7782_01305 [Psychromonas sp.]
MIDTQTWALIADTYTPVLVFMVLYYLKKSNKVIQKQQAIALIKAIAVVYLLMFIDNYFSIWLSMGMDYSTHTAIALVFVVVLSYRSLLHLIIASLSLVLYGLLMRYLNYHSIADVVSTIVVLLPIFILFNRKGQ